MTPSGGPSHRCTDACGCRRSCCEVSLVTLHEVFLERMALPRLVQKLLRLARGVAEFMHGEVVVERGAHAHEILGVIDRLLEEPDRHWRHRGHLRRQLYRRR